MTDKNRSDQQPHLYVQAKEINAEEFQSNGKKIVVSKKKRVSISGFHHPHRDNCPSYEVENDDINGDDGDDGDVTPTSTLRSPTNVSTTHGSHPSFLITFILSWLQPTRVGIEPSYHTASMKYDENSATRKRYMDKEHMTPTPQTLGVSQSEKTTNMITRMVSEPIASFLSLKTRLNRSSKVKPIEPIVPIPAPVVSPADAINKHIPDLSTHSFHRIDADSYIAPDKYLPFSRQCSIEQELFILEGSKSGLSQDE